MNTLLEAPPKSKNKPVIWTLIALPFLGLSFLLLAYFGVLKDAKNAYQSTFNDGVIFTTIDAVAVQLELPCDRLMNIGLNDHCRLYYDDGVSIRISPMTKEEQEQEFGSDHPLAPRCDDKAEFRDGYDKSEEWVQKVMTNGFISICTYNG